MHLPHTFRRLAGANHRRRVLLAWSEHWRRRSLFVIGGIAVGACAALLARLADLAQHLFAATEAAYQWLPWLLTPIGFGVSAFIAGRWFPNSQGSGIPQTIAAHRTADPQRRGRLVSLKVAFGKLALTLLGLLCGASAGREGPTVQIGAAIMFAAGKLTQRAQSGLIVAGGAAGVAAAFNAPLAGIMFGIEEMSRSFERHTIGLILAAVITAGLTAMAILGNYTYFGSTSASIGRADWFAVILCGLVGGMAGGMFSRMIIAAGNALWIRRIISGPKLGAVRFATLCGLGVVVCGALSHNSVYGTGYSEVRAAMDGEGSLHPSFVLLKFSATVLTSISGIPGGIFSPSLSIGAGLGADLAPLLGAVDIHALMLLGMVAYLAGVVQAPITAFVIVNEMTDDRAMLMPLMAAALLAHGASRLICREGVYHSLARKFLDNRSTHSI